MRLGLKGSADRKLCPQWGSNVRLADYANLLVMVSRAMRYFSAEIPLRINIAEKTVTLVGESGRE